VFFKYICYKYYAALLLQIDQKEAVSKVHHLPWHFDQDTPPQRGGER
jgi:hypothetical protein